MDPDVGLVWDLLRHMFPEFTIKHAEVYKILWRLEPKSADAVEAETRFSKATIYKILHQLVLVGLVNKTPFKPVGYYATDPLKAYNTNAKKVLAKLEGGKAKIGLLASGSSGLSGELYLVGNGAGQQKLLLKHSRIAIKDTIQLLQIKKAAEQQIREAEDNKAKVWAVYR